MNLQTSMFVAMSCEEFKKLLQETIQTELQSLKEVKPQQKEDVLLSVDELRSFLQVSKVTIHKWKKLKLIKYYRIGRKIYFKKDEIISSLSSIRKLEKHPNGN